jgi:lysophospholipid acyltransferase (LPLAT)-like uncharacterized protein
MKNWLLVTIAYYLMKFIRISCRYSISFEDKSDEEYFWNVYKRKTQDKYVLCFFHQDELCLIPYFQNTGLGVLVSLSKDGSLMARLAEKLGYITTRGSSSRGAVAGLIAAIKKVKEGHSFSMAVDGPRGPIFKVKEGAIKISEKTETPIIPVRAKVEGAFIFKKSWNQAKLPKPFSRIDFKCWKNKNVFKRRARKETS